MNSESSKLGGVGKISPRAFQI
ncbi:hypothetical protein MTR67_025820 [Solanum verrucosum]|uniref:Uncharacterized protein n=1 Tax=Solanum verrucosum TaxID=315347 RepID=A0AAF0R0Y9_SOLVR|nr:hypothetical protein MTR67_025820 [Solanum verrucosum]